MLLRYSLGLEQEALAIEGAVDQTLVAGCRTWIWVASSPPSN